MRYLLSRGADEVLARYAWSKTVLAFDFDGTLAPIVARPDSAAMRASTRSRLIRVAERYPCFVISGRSLVDVKARMHGVPLVDVIGNHGLEPSPRMREYSATATKWKALLTQRLQSVTGIEIEDKHYSLAVHYRRSRSKRAARAAIAEAVVRLGPGARMIAGKQVVNVVPLGAPHKGMALERLRAEARADTAIFVGDDVTDEDVFSLDQPGRLLAIRIVKTRNTDAPYFLRSQSEIDRLLDRLIALRTRATSHRLEEP
jgi:trehalose 6-phosphate phosphatase